MTEHRPSAPPWLPPEEEELGEATTDGLSWGDSLAGEPGPEQAGARGPTIGPYRLLGLLGQGGMSVVYRAQGPDGQEVALKVLRAGAWANEASRRRLRREAEALAGLRHPNIIRVLDSGEHEGALYYTMPLVKGVTLAERLREGPLPLDEAVRIAAALAEALHAAHQVGVVHRDVKPANVLMDGARPVLMDFGLVRSADASTLTHTGQIMGTPAYMSPEQAAGLGAVDARSDQFSLGLVLFEMWTGERAFAGDPAVVLGRVRGEDLTARMPAGPLKGICARALQKAPEDRYRDLQAFAEDLARLRRGEAPLARAPGWLSPHGALRTRLRRHRAAALLVGLGLVAGAAALGTALRTRAQEDADRRDTRARWLAVAQRIQERDAAGDAEGGDTLFIDFTENLPDAVVEAEAWQIQAERLHARGALGRAVEARAQVFALAEGEDERAEALVALTLALHANREWGGLATTLDLLGAPSPSAPQDPRLRQAARDLALSERDFTGAAALTADPGEADMLRQLSAFTELPLRADAAFTWDSDGDGVQELWLMDQAQAALRRSDGARTLAMPPLDQAEVVPLLVVDAGEGPAMLLAFHEKRCRLMALEGDALTPLVETPCGRPRDLYLHSPSRLLVAADRQLLRFERGPEGWSAAPEPISLNWVNSVISGLVPWDGMLVTAARGWGAYDARLYAWEGEHLVLQDRLQLGALMHLTPLRTPEGRVLAATQPSKPEQFRNPRVFGAEPPEQLTPGLHLLDVESGALQVREVLPLSGLRDGRRGQGLQVRHAFAADLDGDGWDELLLAQIQDSWLTRRSADGRWSGMPLGGLRALGAAQLDEDPAMELLLTEDGSALLILGAGEGTLSPARRAPTVPASPPPGLQGPLEARWRRAELIAALDMPALAGALLVRVAREARGSEVELDALLRAAALHERAEAPGEALALLREATRGAPSAPRAWEALYTLARTQQLTDVAAEAAAARLALPDPPEGLDAELDTLRAWLAQPALDFDLSTALPDAWSVEDPAGLFYDGSGRGVSLRGAGEQAILSVPLARGEGPVRISLRFTHPQPSWGARWLIGLSTEGEAVPGLQALLLGTGGGGGLVHTGAACPGPIAVTHPPDAKDTPEATRELEWSWSPEAQQVRCVYRVAGEQVLYSVAPWDGPLPEEPIELQVRAWAPETSAGELRLERLSLRGLALRDRAPRPWDLAYRALARGDGREATRALQAAPEEELRTWIARALAAHLEGDAPVTREAVRQALRRWPEAARLRLLLLHLGPLGEVLEAALGERYASALWTTHQALLITHPGEPISQRPLLQYLPPGSARAWGDPVASIHLLTHRAAALRRQGQLAEARADLREALTLGADHPADASDGALREALAGLHRERARLAIAAGDPEGAALALVEALRASPGPAVFADMLAHDEAFAPLHEHRVWETLEATRRRGAAALEGY
ncbi:MAG: protein kinase [Alphaproteobacteria bacterium]|nr:protein kinase [Alphaproteobacteria bacterium]